MNVVEYANSELSKIVPVSDQIQEVVNKDILQLVELFESQGHSESSAQYVTICLERLLRMKPLTPLTGEDSEWDEVVGSSGLYLNRRCSSVVKESDGNCYDLDSVEVSHDGGDTWSYMKEFADIVQFPYYPPTYPKKVYIEYHLDSEDSSYDVITDDVERIQNLYNRKKQEMSNEEY